MLPLVFDEPADWELIGTNDRLTITGLAELGPGSRVTVGVAHSAGPPDEFGCSHRLSEQQVEGFRAGSALNYLRQQA